LRSILRISTESGRELVDRAVVVITAVDGRSIEAARRIGYQSVVGEGSVRDALELVNDGELPPAFSQRTRRSGELEDRAAAAARRATFARRSVQVAGRVEHE